MAVLTRAFVTSEWNNRHVQNMVFSQDFTDLKTPSGILIQFSQDFTDLKTPSGILIPFR